MRTRLLAAGVLLLATTACASNPRSGTGWVRLGEHTVSDRAEGDRFIVGAGRGEFRAIRLTVDRTSVDFYRVTVLFANGRRQEVSIRRTIPAGGETRTIDLDGGARTIRAVEIIYDSNTLGRRRAEVTLYGRR